jgi:motility quorum-sensing regulator / GCU-specific mRNA interferase toxin
MSGILMQHFNKPHYDLDELKQLIEDPKTRVITEKARTNAFSTLGLITDDEIVQLILTIKKSDIYKTMTSDYNTKLWQDVYKPVINDNTLYIKLQKNFKNDGVVIQLKLSESD